MTPFMTSHLVGVAAGGGLPNGSYTTNFPLTENPISESGVWVCGLADGLDWTNPRTVPGIAFGTESGGSGHFDDSVAHLKGTWANDQEASAVVHLGVRPTFFAEIEILLRFTITGHDAHGYEVYFSMQGPGNRYIKIARWNGALDDALDLTSLGEASSPTIINGDTVRATIAGTVITAYVNGSPLLNYDTSGDAIKWASGKPGLGFYALSSPASSEYGFSSYTALNS